MATGYKKQKGNAQLRSFIYTMLALLLVFGPTEAFPLTLKRTVAYSTSEGCLPSQLRGTLSVLRQKFGKVTVISSYRRGARIAGTSHESKHAHCQAVDFTVQKQAAAIKWLWTQPIEVIPYNTRQFHHIHIAVGSYKGWKLDRRSRKSSKLPTYATLTKH